jgi:hypothetical protein
VLEDKQRVVRAKSFAIQFLVGFSVSRLGAVSAESYGRDSFEDTGLDPASIAWSVEG